MFRSRRSLGFVAVALCLVVLRTAGFAQSPQSPTFRSTVDLLTIDTSVRDKDGQVVPDLQASDFIVTIDGKPRKVVSTVFFKAEPTGARVTGGAAPTPQHVSNEQAQPGRVVVFALDAESITAGQERPLFETASRMLEGLSPADAVGIQEMPGPAIELTRDHASIAAALRRFRGRARRELEQIAIGRNPALMENTVRAHDQQILLDLASLVRRLAVVRAPRSVILISGGFNFDLELMSQYKEIQAAASEARVSLYTVLVEQSAYGVERGETRRDVVENPALSEGPATIASMAGGMFFTGIAMGAGLFDRLKSEVTSFYQLGLESSPADADGKQHDLKVRVTRSGVGVRAPSHVIVNKPPTTGATRDLLVLALQQPTDVAGVPLAVSTYSTPGDGGAVRLLVSLEVGGSSTATETEWAVQVLQNGKRVSTKAGTLPPGSVRPGVISTSVDVPPGDYRLRVAAADADAHLGVLDIPVTAGLQAAGDAMLGDLIVGVSAGTEFEPRRRIARSEEVTAVLETSAKEGVFKGGVLQLIPAGSARSVQTTPLSVRPGAAAGAPTTLQARASLAAVPAGRYTASVAVDFAGAPATRINRIIEVIGPAPVVTQPAIVATPVAEEIRPAPAPVPESAPMAASVADEVVRKAAAYVEQYGGQASLLVGIERYSQTVTRTAVPTAGAASGMRGMAGNSPVDAPDAGPVSVTERRRLVSEFALASNTSTSGGWLGYRDVMELDGKPVANAGSRLQAIFRADVPDVVEARRIATESARYNIGPVSRNFNIPTTTLFFFPAANLSRFAFRRTGRERIDGVDTIVFDFQETRRPTLIMNSAGKDVPASGTLWVNPLDGAIVRTRLELEKFDQAGSKAVVEVQYQRDKVLAMWVPARMTEKYSGTAFSGGAKSTATTVATYTDFKRFQTSIKIK